MLTGARPLPREWRKGERKNLITMERSVTDQALGEESTFMLSFKLTQLNQTNQLSCHLEIFRIFTPCCTALNKEPYAPKVEVIPIEQAALYWAIQRLHGGHHCWMSWPALDKENLLQPFLASTRESKNSWPGRWFPCLFRRLTWEAAETMLPVYPMPKREFPSI